MDTSYSDSEIDESSKSGESELQFDEDELLELEENILEHINDYTQTHLLHYASPNFASDLIKYVAQIVYEDCVIYNICKQCDEDYAEIEHIVKSQLDLYRTEISTIPPRQRPNTVELSRVNVPDMQRRIERLRAIPQPQQRTPEWYESRYHMMTASNIYKALGSEALRNSLIYEKCKPFVAVGSGSGSVNVDNAMHWGVKYEPVSKMLYEDIYCTTVEEFGCIPHQTYPFIGASPDGIVVDAQHERYGHMVEIKNIVNREITGIPKEEYWVQMQVQMETCDLDHCDFMETRVKEYASKDAAFADAGREYRGVILYCLKKISISDAMNGAAIDNSPHYVYMPLDIPFTPEAVEEWIRSSVSLALEEEDYVLYETLYWYLDEMSCILVPRNREWFRAAAPVFSSIWDTIQKERMEGYEHRATSKKKKVEVLGGATTESHTILNMPAGQSLCLIKLDENGDVVTD